MKNQNHNTSNFKITFILVILFSLQSCQYFDKKAPNENQLLQQRLKEINWNEVDTYPAISYCDSIAEIDQRKKCFFEFLNTTIRQNLIDDKVYVKFPNIDTLRIKVVITANASVEFSTILSDSAFVQQIKLDSILKVNLKNLPTFSPALKRGIPVKTQFTLPVILKPD